jgi:hypothetical protein
VNATLNAIESSSDIGVSQPYVWISQGATLTQPITARVLSNGVPQKNIQVNFTILSGSGTLSGASALTNSSGYATVNLTVTQIAAEVKVSACVAPSNLPCSLFYGNVISLDQQRLEGVAGAGQISNGTLQPIVVRVTDSASPPDAVLGAPVSFLTTVLRAGGTSSGGGSEEAETNSPSMPVILNVSQISATTDVNGLANILPSSAGFSAPVEVDVSVTAGTSQWLDYPLQILPKAATGTVVTGNRTPPQSSPPVRIPRRGTEMQ